MKWRVHIATILLFGLTACNPNAPDNVASDATAKNIEVIRYQLEQMDQGNLDVFDELCTEDYRYHSSGSSRPLTCQEHKESAREFYTAFSSFGHVIEKIVAAEDMVVVQMINFGTHTGFFAGRPQLEMMSGSASPQ